MLSENTSNTGIPDISLTENKDPIRLSVTVSNSPETPSALTTVEFKVLLLICNLLDGPVKPIPTSPKLLTTNGFESGLVPSSTTSAFPVPTCVILTISTVVEPDAIISGID